MQISHYLGLALLAGCAHLPARDAIDSFAFAPDSATRLGALYGADGAAHPGQSGFLVLNRGEQAWLARAAVTDLADHSIDAQYFDWEGDRVGRLLIERLLRAADRGVRVRLLVDDFHVHGRDRALLALDAHPNIEVRVFNPYVARTGARLIELLRRFSHLNHRMHNKMFIVDGQALVMGGRNIADEYFGLSDKYDFRDIDLLAVGTVVGEAEGAFDAYWNNRWAFPITSLDHHARDLASMIANIYRAIDDTYRNFPYRTELPPDQIMRRLGEREHELVWAPAELVFDPPDKIAGIKHHQPTAAAAHGYELAADAQHEIVAEAAYFVPGDLTRIRELRRRGVTVRLLTNSLASTDLIPVHAAYRKTRRRVVELGVELREVNTWAPSRAIYIAQLGPKTTLSLHAKVSVIDRSTVYLGSVNLDPRSTYLNTEVAVAIHSPELAERVLAALSRDFEDINSWRVVIDDDGAVRWHGARSGRTRCRTAEPDATLGRRFKASIFALLPIRSLL